MISLNIDLYFRSCPEGADKDNLKGTVCYFELVQLVTSYCQSRSFNVIENLTQSIYKAISSFLSPSKHLIESIKIEASKVSPPVPNVHGGVRWTHHIAEDKG